MRPKIIKNNIYHVLSRGVDKRKIFLDDYDYLRFLHDLFEFNNKNPTTNTNYRFKKKSIKYMDIASRYIQKKPRKLLVKILAFCLMPNHYHLLLTPLSYDGLSRFMKKVNMGYAKYFNEKYHRTGTLFEGRYKLVPINQAAHFIHIPYYIHLNPLDLIEPKWRKGEIKNYQKAIDFLKDYRWSSHLDYLGQKNFPSLTQRDFLLKIFGNTKKYQKDIEEWLQSISLRKKEIQSFIIEE